MTCTGKTIPIIFSAHVGEIHKDFFGMKNYSTRKASRFFLFAVYSSKNILLKFRSNTWLKHWRREITCYFPILSMFLATQFAKTCCFLGLRCIMGYCVLRRRHILILLSCNGLLGSFADLSVFLC